MATATAAGIEKYHKGCNLVVLLYCEQLSMQQIITVSASSLEILCHGAYLKENVSNGSAPFLNVIFSMKLFNLRCTYEAYLSWGNLSTSSKTDVKNKRGIGIALSCMCSIRSGFCKSVHTACCLVGSRRVSGLELKTWH